MTKETPGGVGIFLKGWQAVIALITPIIVVAAIWGASAARLTHLEDRAVEDREAQKVQTEALRALLQDHAERLVKLETWRDGPQRPFPKTPSKADDGG